MKDWLDQSHSAYSKINSEELKSFQPGTWEFIIRRELARARHDFAAQLLAEAIRQGGNRPLLEVSLHEFNAIEEFFGTLEPSLYKNRGIAYETQEHYDPQAHAGMIENYRKFLAHPDAPSDPDYTAIQKQVYGHP